ncbi:A-kinase anchor protein 7 isoforms alpha and beta [Bulinus truncatus]|nr:A-kinase anchor protein 7 isoforms alpha and beta [Bulinus truncatus]
MEQQINNDKLVGEKLCPLYHQTSIDGKCHILPVSILLNLKKLVEEHRTQIVKQIIQKSSVICPESEIDDIGDKISAKNESCLINSSELEETSCEQLAFSLDLENDDFPSYIQSKHTIKKTSNQKNSGEDNGQTALLKQPSGGKKGESLSPTHQPKKKKQSPNYFIAVQITDPEIHCIAKKVQTAIQDGYEFSIASTIIGSEKFHITLMVMHLANKEDRQRAAVTLDKCVPSILEKTCGQKMMLHMEGVSAFSGGRVVFAGLKPSEGLDHLQFISDEVHRHMNEEGIFTTDKRSDFHPHMTLIKFKGDKKLLKLGFRKVTPDKYEPFLNQVFGSQSIASLQLCSMDKKREDGYYYVDHEVFIPKVS